MKLPRHEPEIVAAGARRFGGDDEKVADTAVGNAHVEGVSVSSRYNKAHEVELMAHLIAGVSPPLRKHIVTLFCDSKAGSSYAVDLDTDDAELAKVIGHHLDIATMSREPGGHNGIYLNLASGETIVVDPNWPM